MGHFDVHTGVSRLLLLLNLLLSPFILVLHAHELIPSSRSLSFQLLLQRPPPLNLHNNNHPMQQQQQPPLTGPHLFSNEPLVQYYHNGSAHEQAQIINVGSACGLYLADPSDSREVRYVYFTATLQHYIHEEGTHDHDRQLLSGSLVIIGSLSAGALSIAGGTGDFAFTFGQAKVSIRPATSDPSLCALSLDLDLIYEHTDPDLLGRISIV